MSGLTSSDRGFQLRRTMHDGDVRARTKHLERRLRRGVAAADDNDALAIVRMRLSVVVVHVGRFFSRHTDVPDGRVLIAMTTGA